MGSARTSTKEFEQLKGSLGSAPKASQSSTSTMAQSFRSDHAMAGGGFGSAQVGSQSAGGAFQPMGQGMGSLSSTGPIQCSKKKEAPKEPSMNEKVEAMTKLNSRDLIETMLDLQTSSSADADGKNSQEASIYDLILGTTMQDASWVDLIVKMQGEYAAKNIGKLKNFKQNGELSPEAQFSSSEYGLRHSGYGTMLSMLGFAGKTNNTAIGQRTNQAASILQAANPKLVEPNTKMTGMGLHDYSKGLSPEGVQALNDYRVDQEAKQIQATGEKERPWNKKKHHFRRWLNK